MSTEAATQFKPLDMRSPGSVGGSGDEIEIEIALGPLAPDSPLRPSCDYVVANPGKRFRAAVLEAAAAYGPASDPVATRRAAAAIELFHAATLAHDDVVDDGDLRRGRPTVGAHAGNIAASLSGAWLFARAGELIAEIDEEAVTRFAATAATVCEGEMWETRDLYDVGRSRAGYLKCIEAKTAVLIAFAAWLGARVGGAPSQVAERLEDYGMAVGMGFQIVDDILDLTADPAITGKTKGSDLRGGVYTLPAIHAFGKDADLRRAFLDNPEESELPALIEGIEASGGVKIALAEAMKWIGKAVEALPTDDPLGEHEQRLLSLAQAVGARAQELV